MLLWLVPSESFQMKAVGWMGLHAICFGIWGECRCVVQFAQLKCWCQHLSLLRFPQHPHIHHQIFMKPWHTCLSYQLRSSSLFCLLFSSTSFTASCIVFSYKNADQKRTFFFFPSMLCMCWPYLGNFCISWAFSWVIFILTVYATVSVVFAMLLLWILSALLPQVLFF